MDFAAIFTVDNMTALFTLALLEIVLGIDNLVFISILSSRVDPAKRSLARKVGLAAALGTRLVLLFSLSWIASLTKPLFTIGFIQPHGEPWQVTGEALVLAFGGMFLLWKSVSEIYHKVELREEQSEGRRGHLSFAQAIVNIAIMDIVFSLDSVITAVGMAEALWVMVGGVVIAMVVMVIFADAVAEFINKYASLKILALAFLLMIGTLLVAEALEYTIPKGFVYFAMFFSLGVELVQIRYEANLERKLAEKAAG